MTNTPEVVNALPAELGQATINPEQYAAAVIAPFTSALELAISEDVTDYDATTTAGMKTALSRRAVFRDIRVSADKERAARKAPLLEIGRLLDAKAKELVALSKPYEEHHDAVIKAEEARKAEEKAEKERIERERIARIHEYIADINAIPSKLVGKSAEAIRTALSEAEAMEIGIDVFADFTGTAMQARLFAVAKLIPMLAAQEEHEAEQARLKADREELVRQQAEQRRIDAEAALVRQEAEAKAQAEQAEADRVAAELRASEQAKLDAQMAAFKKEQEAFRAEQEAARLASQAISDAEEQQRINAAEPAPVAEPTPAPVAEPVAVNVHALNKPKPANRPSDMAIVSTLAMHYRVHEVTIVDWLQRMDLESVSSELEKEFA